MAVHPAIFMFATNIGLVLDKYILQTTSATKKFFTDDFSLPKGGLFEVSTLLGYPFGMILFGPLSDVIGRRACMITTATMTFVGATGSMLAWDVNALIAFRILIGLGAGGEYPLAAVHTSEGAEKKFAARNVGILYLSATVGTALAPLVAVILLSIFPTDPESKTGGNIESHNQAIWRGTFGVASVLSLIGLVLRIMTTKNSDEDERRSLLANSCLVTKYWKPLLSTSFSWLFYDVVEYGLKNNQVDILGDTTSLRGSLWESVLTNSISLVFISIAAISVYKIPSKWCQLFGFCALVIVNGIIAGIYDNASNNVFVLLYILQSAFQAFPGVTTIAIPAEIFPAQVKGTCHGISAMTGKLGAIFGTEFFATQDNNHVTFAVVAVACALGTLTTLLFTPKYRDQNLIWMEKCAKKEDHNSALMVLYDTPEARDLVKDTSSSTLSIAMQGSLAPSDACA